MDEAREELLRIRRELNEMDRTYDVADGYPSSSPSPERHISEACTATAASRIEEVVTEVQEQREVAAAMGRPTAAAGGYSKARRRGDITRLTPDYREFGSHSAI